MTISRTGLLSFIAKQRWPGIVRRRAEEVTAANPDGLPTIAVSYAALPPTADFDRITSLLDLLERV